MATSVITKIEIIPIQIPLHEPFVISKGALTHARNTVVIIYNSDGLFGTGECCPYRSIHGETQTGTVAFAKELAKVLIGENPREIHKHVALMDKMIVGNASVKGAFDMALYDLVSKMDGLPLYAFLNGSNTKKIYTDNTISLLSKEKMVEKGLKFKEQGFTALKVKLGEKPSKNDVSRIEGIRKAVGSDIAIRVDANQGWNYQEALYAVRGMQEFDIEHCEEPIQAGNTQDQTRLTSLSPIPIMADESAFNHYETYRVLSQNAAHSVNIKLGKSGGILNASKVASICQAANVYCQVGSFSESRLGISALVHFDLAWDHIIFHDLDSPIMLSEDPVIGGLQYGDRWQVTVDESPGHGASFDPKFLSKFEKFTAE